MKGISNRTIVKLIIVLILVFVGYIKTSTNENKDIDDSQVNGISNQTYTVLDIVDGDTIKASEIGTIRLIGVDTPETVDPRKEVQCFGIEASNKTKEFLTNKNIRLEYDLTQGMTDKYGRILAYVYREDGLFINLELIKQGYAYEYTYSVPYKYQTEFKQAQANARASLLGLWGMCN